MQSYVTPQQISMQPQNGHIDLKNLCVPLPIKYLIQYGDSMGEYPSRSDALFAVLSALVDAGHEDDYIAPLCLLESHGISELPREKGPAWLRQELQRVRRKAISLARLAEGAPEDSDDLLDDTIPPPKPIVDGLLYEGMLLFGGKAKRGKSWMMLDLALSVATGKPVWGHFAVPEPQPVLYIALEDPRGRIKRRLEGLRPDIADARADGYLHLVYKVPKLNKGGLEKIQGYIESGRYRLIVIDVLAKVEPAARQGAEKTYLEIYEMFESLQDLNREHPLCLAMITHLRKSEAEDIFDTLHGSVAYQGVQDALWVMDRPPQNAVAVLHTRPNDGEEQVLHVSFAGGRWEFLGHDADIRLSQERQAVREILEENEQGVSIANILKGLSHPRDRYQAVKKLVYRMLEDDQAVRIGRGLYGPPRKLL